MNNDASEKTSPRGFPLGALFLLLTVSGMLAGIAGVAVRDSIQSLGGAFVVGMAAAFVGAIFGLARTLRMKGALTGGLTGLVVGGFAGTVAVLRAGLMLESTLICIGASVLIIVVALVLSRRG